MDSGPAWRRYCKQWSGLAGHEGANMSRALVEQGLKVHAQHGHDELTAAFQTLIAPGDAQAARELSSFAFCAMEMGTVKECDVLLTYAQHMDTCKMCAIHSPATVTRADYSTVLIVEEARDARKHCHPHLCTSHICRHPMQGCRAQDVRDWGGGAQPCTFHCGWGECRAAAAHLGVMRRSCQEEQRRPSHQDF